MNPCKLQKKWEKEATYPNINDINNMLLTIESSHDPVDHTSPNTQEHCLSTIKPIRHINLDNTGNQVWQGIEQKAPTKCSCKGQ